jgi:hypothetical protein
MTNLIIVCFLMFRSWGGSPLWRKSEIRRGGRVRSAAAEERERFAGLQIQRSRVRERSEAQCEKRSEAELQLYEASSYDLVIDSRQDIESCWKG